MRALLLILLLCAGAAKSETVAITTGEHDGFSRIVLDLEQPTPWKFGRTPDGYRLSLARDGIRYDLREVFRLIPRTRLAAIWADPETGDLNLGIGCACHAQPFEFRDDIIVIDIKNGPPPPGSSFELAIDGSAVPTLVARLPPRPRSRPAAAMPDDAEWSRMFRDSQAPVVALPPAELQAMQQTLLQQLSRSAAQGLVDMEMPADGLSDTAAAQGGLTGGQVVSRLGPGIVVQTARDPEPELTPQGDTCIEDARLNVADWADSRPFTEQFAEVRILAVGEFDRPDEAAVSRKTRLLLHFGFGAEARANLAAFPIQPDDAPIWAAMALIVDGDEVAPDGPFAGQADCDTNAALWSVLSQPVLQVRDRASVPAVLRAFSGLPLGLRRQLGPGLSDRFLSIDDAASARAIRSAIQRAPGDPGDAAHLADARIDLHDGQHDAAVARIEAVATEGGPMLPEALIDLVDARLVQGEPVDPGTIDALASVVEEQGDGPLGPALRRAKGLALASAGEFASAFAISASETPGFDAELWPLLAQSGPDSALLAQAVLPRGSIPETDAGTSATIAGRLIDLGFPDSGLAWLGTPQDEGQSLLAARAEIARRDGRAALRVLAGQTGAEAESLRAEAQVLLGDPAAASSAFAAAGDGDAAERALWQGQDWAAIAASDGDPVLVAAAALALPANSPPTAVDPAGQPSPDGPLPASTSEPPTTLAAGRALIEDSAAVRAAVSAMLEAVGPPEIGQP